jgi:trehalose/maltose transport system substrate-binding protein
MIGVVLLAYTTNRRRTGNAIYQPLTRLPFATDSTLVDKKKAPASRCGTPALWLSVLVWVCFSPACSRAPAVVSGVSEPDRLTLTMLANGQNAEDVSFLAKALDEYRRRTGIRIMSVAGYDSVDTRLTLMQDLFARNSPEPNIIEIDNTWPGLLADDLVDLRPYLKDETTAIDGHLLDAFTVNGRLVALPDFLDIPVLYYRADLLRKYGYPGPPRTWDELGRMAKVIQDGERKAGAINFWGYLWQGAEGEALNCNAFEWERAEGATLIESSGKICANSSAAEFALRRARSWVGTISPPSVVEYDEEDTSNIWLAGSSAFTRGWLALYAPSKASPIVGNKFSTAPMPAGKAGYAWTFGGMGLAISRYSPHHKEAAEVLRYLVSSAIQKQRLIASSTIPSRTSLLSNAHSFGNTGFNPWLSKHWQQGMFNRPSAKTGKKYEALSRAYSRAVHNVISGKQDPHQALHQLQTELTSIMR